jgi:hypothetical protein
MSVVDGQIANAATFNGAFASKQDNNTLNGVQTLAHAGSGATVSDVQQTINDNSDDISTLFTDLNNHVTDLANPHVVTKAQVGLSVVDNTSDLDKPISTATQAALDLKASIEESIVNALIFG